MVTQATVKVIHLSLVTLQSKLYRETVTMRDTLINTYLDYVNNYLSVAKYAEHNGLTNDQALELLSIARKVFQSTHPEA